MRRLAILLLIPLALIGRAEAQAQAPAPPAAPAAPVEPDPPYMSQLLRLAEILGAVHFLQNLCGTAADRSAWREEMAALLDAESPNPERKTRLVASFNRGYRGFSETYRTCTDSARASIERYRGEGAKIAREIVARYGG